MNSTMVLLEPVVPLRMALGVVAGALTSGAVCTEGSASMGAVAVGGLRVAAGPVGAGAALAAALFAAAVLAALGWLARWAKRYARWRAMELAMPGPLSVPILGSAHLAVGVNEHSSFEMALGMWGGRHSELSRVVVLNTFVVFISDPHHISQVVRRFTDKPWIIYGPLSGVLGDGLVTSSGAYWKRHRTTLTPTFHLEVLERFQEVFAEEARAFVGRLRALTGRDVEFAEEMHKATANSVLRTTLSSTIEEEDKDELEVVVQGVTNTLTTVNMRSMRPWLWPEVLFRRSALGREQTAYRRLVRGYFSRLIDRKTREVRGELGHRDLESKLGFKARKTVLDLLLEGTLSGQFEFSRQEMTDECVTIFGTAVETSVTALTFVFKMLSIRPDVQERVFAELGDVFDGSDRLVTNGDLPKLQYMERVIKETLRIFPIGPFVARRVDEDVQVCGKWVPAGAVLVINIFGAHRDPRHHPDPLRFDPDRFLPDRVAGWHPNAYMPFSAGPRNCIGHRYAMMQMKTILATTLRAYSILPADDGITHPSEFRLTFDIALRLVGGTRVRFEPRVAVAAA